MTTHDSSSAVLGPDSQSASAGMSSEAQLTPAEQFQLLAATWRKATAHMSSSSDKVAHPAFQAIVNLGPNIIPILLQELAHGSGHWHRALQRITSIDPVPPADQGNLEKITAAWLQWGREQGYS